MMMLKKIKKKTMDIKKKKKYTDNFIASWEINCIRQYF